MSTKNMLDGKVVLVVGLLIFILLAPIANAKPCILSKCINDCLCDPPRCCPCCAPCCPPPCYPSPCYPPCYPPVVPCSPGPCYSCNTYPCAPSYGLSY